MPDVSLIATLIGGRWLSLPDESGLEHFTVGRTGEDRAEANGNFGCRTTSCFEGVQSQKWSRSTTPHDSYPCVSIRGRFAIRELLSHTDRGTRMLIKCVLDVFCARGALHAFVKCSKG